jgi:hypothetical protein
VLVHYSETHDNDRLAKQGRAWSLMRNRLAALTCQSGAWGYTAGVEWLADGLFLTGSAEIIAVCAWQPEGSQLNA